MLFQLFQNGTTWEKGEWERGVLAGGKQVHVGRDFKSEKLLSLFLKICISDGPPLLCRWISSPTDCGREVAALDMRLASP